MQYLFATSALIASALAVPSATAFAQAPAADVNENIKLVSMGESIPVARIPDGIYLRSVNDPDDIIWDRVPEYRVHLTPAPAVHQSIALRLDAHDNRDAYVTLAQTADRFYVRLRWLDDSKNDITRRDRFTDGAAIQFSLGDDTTSYMMGTGPDAPVNIWYWSPENDSVQNLAAGGYGSTTLLKEQPVTGASQYTPTDNRGNKEWVVVMSRPLDAQGDYQISFDQEQIPIAFALWEGSKSQRDGNKNVTHGWILADMGGQ